jgi:hypothetical protein
MKVDISKLRGETLGEIIGSTEIDDDSMTTLRNSSVEQLLDRWLMRGARASAEVMKVLDELRAAEVPVVKRPCCIMADELEAALAELRVEPKALREFAAIGTRFVDDWELKDMRQDGDRLTLSFERRPPRGEERDDVRNL